MVSSKQTGKSFEKRIIGILEREGIECKLVPFSGAGKDEKGDIQTRIGNIDFLVECKKTRGRETWTIMRSMLEKIEEQARNERKEPLLVFGFKNSKTYVILPFDNFMEMNNVS